MIRRLTLIGVGVWDCQVDCVFRPITPESVRQSEWPIGCESVPSSAA